MNRIHNNNFKNIKVVAQSFWIGSVYLHHLLKITTSNGYSRLHTHCLTLKPNLNISDYVGLL